MDTNNKVLDKPVILEKIGGGTCYGNQVKFVEWSGNTVGSRAKQLHDEPQVGYSCIIDPQYSYQYTWLTTEITEISNIGVEQERTTYKFKTKNSEYILHVMKEEDDLSDWDVTLNDGLEDLDD